MRRSSGPPGRRIRPGLTAVEWGGSGRVSLLRTAEASPVRGRQLIWPGRPEQADRTGAGRSGQCRASQVCLTLERAPSGARHGRDLSVRRWRFWDAERPKTSIDTSRPCTQPEDSACGRRCAAQPSVRETWIHRRSWSRVAPARPPWAAISGGGRKRTQCGVRCVQRTQRHIGCITTRHSNHKNPANHTDNTPTPARRQLATGGSRSHAPKAAVVPARSTPLGRATLAADAAPTEARPVKRIAAAANPAEPIGRADCHSSRPA